MRVTSPDLDSRFSMVAVAPAVYRQIAVDGTLWSNNVTNYTELSVSMGSTVPIDLGFNFPFFGLAYDRVWVSSAGYVAFEQPAIITGGFVGLDAMHSAVAAAAGEYDLAHPGATLTVAHVKPLQLEVVWHAPLFGSSKFTDVALRLGLDGTVSFRWERIVLDAARHRPIGRIDNTEGLVWAVRMDSSELRVSVIGVMKNHQDEILFFTLLIL